MKNRLFVEGRLSIGTIATLKPSQAHYLKNVLRLSADDAIILVDEAGREFRAEVSGKRGKDMTLSVVEQLASPPRPASRSISLRAL